jgi:sugar/nucleoside kinase (ribokinase family)
MQNASISGIGCSLIDYLYPGIDFNDPEIVSLFSQKALDGGLIPGGLVFVDELEKFTGLPLDAILSKITQGKKPEMINLGGPAIVALINCAQLLESLPVAVKYFGRRGNDATSEHIRTILGKVPLDSSHYLRADGITPSTHVFSDPTYAGGLGERMFVNTMGNAGTFAPHDVPDNFFDSRILLFGATALLPGIHDGLGNLLKKGKQNGCITVVTTVFDFRNAKKHPEARWPLGDDDGNYRNLDLLIVDFEEALNLSKSATIDGAIGFFMEKQTPACIITHGPQPVYLYSQGGFFGKTDLMGLPVSDYVSANLKTQKENRGDTTGCGDNFAGGVISSIAYQLFVMKLKHVDLKTACAWGMASGGFACFYRGGTYWEKKPGEKKENIRFVFNEYQKQIRNIFTCVHDDFLAEKHKNDTIY